MGHILGTFVWQDAVLGAMVLLVLILPLVVRAVEENLEIFLLAAGIGAVTVSGLWSWDLVLSALAQPWALTLAVLSFGLAVHYGRKRVDAAIRRASAALPRRIFIFLTVCILGLVSSIITAVVAALLFVEIVRVLKLNEEHELRLIVLGCFAIGLGAALTPIGEPLSVIVTAQRHGDFFFLFRLLGIYVIPAVVLLGLLAAFVENSAHDRSTVKVREMRMRDVWMRTGKVYVFVIALIFLAAGFRPLIDGFISSLSTSMLYWGNIISAFLDNATLATVEITPSLSDAQATAALLGMLVAGGMLVPGNIPNIIDAGYLRIKSKDWARIGVPAGLILMAALYLAWSVSGR